MFISGPLKAAEDPNAVSPGRRLVVPLHICVLQGLSFVKAQLLSMEFPAHVGENLPMLDDVNSRSTGGHVNSETKMDRLVKIDPFRGSWGLRFLELELSNPTDVVFEINVSVKLEKNNNEDNQDATEYGYPKTRIDRDCSARVLVPLEHFKLPVLDDSFFMKDTQSDGSGGRRNASFSEKNSKAEINACIKNLISRIKVQWHSGRNSSGELNIKDAIQAALQTSVMDVLLPDPLTFGFRLVRDGFQSENPDPDKESDIVESPTSKSSVLAHEMTLMEVLVRNNTREMIKMSLNITCRDVAGENCVDGTKSTVLWTGNFQILFALCNLHAYISASNTVLSCHNQSFSGVLSDITVEIPPLQQIKHSFCLHFLVPGEYTLLAAAVIEDANDILRARARATSAGEPIFCRGPPYHVRVLGTA